MKVHLDNQTDDYDIYELTIMQKSEQTLTPMPAKKKIHLKQSLERKIKEVLELWEENKQEWLDLMYETDSWEQAKYYIDQYDHAEKMKDATLKNLREQADRNKISI